MVNPRIALMLLLGAASITHQSVRADFGETFGATTLGSALGTTVGTVIGHAVSNPRPPRRRPFRREIVYREPVTIVHEVEHVRVPRKSKQSRLDREEANLRAEIESLSMERDSLERRIRALEQELSDTETAISLRKQSLRNVEQRKRELSSPVCITKGPEFAEIEVR